jgi:glycosyltransferase involved in cell wall biosynthesis
VFSGGVDNERMALLYRSAHVMINPSLADNMPISVLEALASGVPIVTTNVGGVPYLVQHEKTALLVPAQNPEAMAEAILSLLNNPVKAEEIRQAGIDSVRQYTWPNVRVRLLGVYTQLLAKTSRSVADVK